MVAGRNYYWKHFCKAEKSFLFVANEEPCNWCDAPQSGPLTQIYTDSNGQKIQVTVDFHDETHESPLRGIKIL